MDKNSSETISSTTILQSLNDSNWMMQNLKNDKVEKINELLSHIKNLQLKNFQMDICIKSAKKCTTQRKQFIEDSEKINNVIILHDLNDNLSSLGLTDTPEKILYNSSLKLKCFIADDIKELYKKTFETMDKIKISDYIKSTLPIFTFYINCYMQELMNIRLIFKQKFDNCYQAVINLCDIIRKIFQLKADNIEHLKYKMTNLNLKLEFIDIKQKVMFCKLQDLILKETPETEKAVDIAIKDLRKSHETLSSEITQMEKDFHNFENISRTSETGKLVRKYISYKEEISRIELVIKEFE